MNRRLRNKVSCCRQFLLLASAYLVVLSASGQETYTVKAAAGSCVNIRTNPSSDATILTCLPPNSIVQVIANVPFWRKIRYAENQEGWIAKKFLIPAAPIQSDTTWRLTIPPEADLTFHFIDVGQGDAIWIQTWDDGIDGNGIYEGYSIIIDGGPYSADGKNALYKKLIDAGHEEAIIEALIVTHPHIDHFAGSETILRHFEVKHYYDPGYPLNQPAYKAFISRVRQKVRTIHIGVDSLTKFHWGAELSVQVLSGWYGDSANQLGLGNTEINNSSLVVQIQYGDHSFLLMGDAEGKDRNDLPDSARYIEKRLLDQHYYQLPSTLLKVGHHGSETSSSIPFLLQVNPSVVIIQSGRKAYSGTYLPDLTTIERIQLYCPDARIYRTDEGDEAAGLRHFEAVDGDHIEVRSNGKGTLRIHSNNR